MKQEQDRAHRAVVYLRVASAQTDSDIATTTQRTACEQIAQRYGVTIVREYIDRGKPARLGQQTELRRLLADLEQLGDAAYVVVNDYARLGRDAQGLDSVIRRVQACGAEVATITGVETARRFTSALLDQVAEWATQPPYSKRSLAVADDLDAAVQIIRRGQLTNDQREALATLVAIAGDTTLPTPVTAAVFNVVTACVKTDRPKKATE
ncbi:MAG TPA: recombinase family protein [Pseudonocardiaceae bacterium]|nr:recombinase family protein [Pseudonocardiaceae bacterium]